MADANAQAVEVSESGEQPAPAVKAAGRVVPEWVNEEHFVDVLQENVEGFKKIQSFEAAVTGGGGENFSSVMVRVNVKVELEDGSTKELAYMLKTIPQEEQTAMMINMMGHFPKEIAMYGQLLPEFEKLYLDVGKTVRFGPKYFEFKKKPETQYVLLEDLCSDNFKNANRIEGLDEEHILAVLKILAELHAASAVRYETVDKYENQFMETMFSEKYRAVVEMIGGAFQKPFMHCLASRPSTAKYVEKLGNLQTKMVDLLIEASNPALSDFNVMIHGDLWSNNIMFRYNDNGQLQDTILIDFQMSRYVPPVADIFYFLLTSPKLELKVACFDKYVKFYHEQLAENLTLLKYPKKSPTLRDLHMQLLKGGIMAFLTVTTTMAGILMNPCEDLSTEKLLGEGNDALHYQLMLYNNPRYVKHLEIVLEWLDLRGLLDL